MASLRRHKRSPYWFLRRKNLDTGVWFEQSTGLKAESQTETRKAQRLTEKVSSEERRAGIVGTGSQAFALWAPEYVAGRSKRYLIAWQAIRAFLSRADVIYPRQVKYGHAAEYLAWRSAVQVHGKHAGHNTALLELKLLSQLMNEAVRREFAESNPLLRLGIAKAAQKIKPEFTDRQIEQLRRAYSKQPDWMSICAEISLYTGCRFKETSIPMVDADLRVGTIRLRDSKRKEADPRKFFTVPIHPRLRPLLKRLKKSKADFTCRLSEDKNGRINHVIKKTVGNDYSFHCYRVTFVTRCHRGGLSEAEAMRLVNHSSSLVHRIYSRLNVADVRRAQKRIPLP